MIQSLSIKNFLSFKDEVIFSFEASMDKKLEDYQVVEVIPGVKLLKLGIIYGANASGKSNLLNAFEFLKETWIYIPESKNKLTKIIPFLLNKQTPLEPSIFELIFFVDKVKYLYYLEIKRNYILKEQLVFYPGIQPAVIFERKISNNVSEVSFGSKVKISPLEVKELTLKCLPNMSVFASYIQINVSIPEIENVLRWMESGFMPAIDSNMELFKYAEEIVSKNKQINEDILDYLKKADFNIFDTRYMNKEKGAINFANDIFSDEYQNSLVEKEKYFSDQKSKRAEIGFLHKIINAQGGEEYYTFPKEFQSSGTLRIFGLYAAIQQAINNNAFLPIDEIESNLHPHLIEFVLEQFLRESKEAQLLVTTHYDGLLEEEDLFRKDNIWFAEKKEDGSTKLYSLSDFNAVNRITSIQKAYKYGKFGAIPNID